MASSLAQPCRWVRGCPLGFGSFGQVSLGLNLDDGVLFAVKSAATPNHYRSLQNEFHILQSLESPLVIRCLGASLTAIGTTPCFNLFMEYMPEGSVADLVKKSGGRLDEGFARLCTRTVLEGLCYLHGQGIVHCDIKGQNILLGSRGEIKIADFGSARRVPSAEISEEVGMRGTPLWMAPEVVQGAEQGTASDIWSLGCTLVEMLQGRPPWASNHDRMSSNDLASLLFRIAYTSESPPLMEKLYSKEAMDFLSKCLEKDPTKRWTAEQLLKHRFLARQDASGNVRLWGCGGQTSPQSVLDFQGDSDMETESSCSFDAFMGCEGTAKLYSAWAQPKESNENESAVARDFGGGWLTVRRMEGWSDDRHKPFFRAEEEMIIKIASQVRLESLSFLSRRLRPVVG